MTARKNTQDGDFHRKRRDCHRRKGTLSGPETVFTKDLTHAGQQILSVMFYRNIAKTTGS